MNISNVTGFYTIHCAPYTYLVNKSIDKNNSKTIPSKKNPQKYPQKCTKTFVTPLV